MFSKIVFNKSGYIELSHRHLYRILHKANYSRALSIIALTSPLLKYTLRRNKLNKKIKLFLVKFLARNIF